MGTPIGRLEQQFGMLRSQAIYYWNPFHRRKLLRFYRQFIPSGALCYDIGAHLGNRLDAWLALDSKVIALDPQPLCYQYMKKYFGKKENATILPQAVGSQEGKMNLNISHLYPTVSTLSGNQWQKALNDASNASVTWDEQVEVDVTTLDLLIEKYGKPDFCKIDVEGFESKVLEGLSQPIPLLSFELLSTMPERYLTCLDLLKKLGDYEFNWSEGDSYQLNFDSWKNEEELLSSIITKGSHLFSGDIYAKLKE